MHLFLIRHGQSYVNLDDWEGGYVDVGLTPLGQQQSERLAKWTVDNLHVAALYSSTMARAAETAAFLAEALGLEARPDDRLREFGNCYADGTPVPPDAMPIHYAEFWGTERPYTRISARGESWLLFRLRVGLFLDDMIARHSEKPDTTVLIVCHGGVIDCAFDYMVNAGPRRYVENMVHNTGITHWQYLPESGREAWRLHGHNMAYHLYADNGEWFGARAVMRDASRKSIPEKKETTDHLK
jgi:probable phosphoglycerate mutase